MFSVCLGVYQFTSKQSWSSTPTSATRIVEYDVQGLEQYLQDGSDTVIAQHNAVVESWKDAISARLPYFNVQSGANAKPPEDVFILQFWYGEQTAKMTKGCGEAQKKWRAGHRRIPMEIQTMLGVAYSEEWQATLRR
jgi:hypothetical protein